MVHLGKPFLGCLVSCVILLGQTNRITIVPNSKGERGVVNFRESLVSNGRNSVGLEGPLAIGKDLRIALPSIKGEVHESLAIIQAPEETTDLDRVRIGFREMVTAFDDGRTFQLISREKRFQEPLRVQLGTYVHDDGDFSIGPVSLYGAGLMSHRTDPMSNADDVELDSNGLRFNNPFTGGNIARFNKEMIRLNIPGALWQVEAGIETLQERADTPAVPPAGYVLRYAKGGVGCTLDSSGSEVCGGGSGAVNPIPYIFSTTTQLRLQQQGGGIADTELVIGGDIGNFGARLECAVVDMCELNFKGSSSDMTLRMEGRPSFKQMPAGFASAGPEFQLGRQASYPNEFAMSINSAAAAMLQGNPMLWVAPDGSYFGMQARNGSRNEVWNWPVDAATDGDCVKVLSAASRTYEHGACGGASSNELPVIMTASGVEKVRFFSLSGNAQAVLKNSSGANGVSWGNNFGGSFFNLTDTNGDGGVEITTGLSSGATIALQQADTTRVGVRLEAGSFSGEAGRLVTRDINGDRSTLSDRLQLRAGGVTSPAVDLGLDTSSSGELRLREGTFGITRVLLNKDGISINGTTPVTRTFTFQTSTGFCTVTVTGSTFTGFSGNCPV